MRFSPKDPIEIVTLSFDFTKDLEIKNASGTVIGMKTITPASQVTTVTAFKGIDADPSALKNGAPQISGNFVLQSAKLGIDENDYLIRTEIDASSGEHFVIGCVLPIRRRDNV